MKAKYIPYIIIGILLITIVLVLLFNRKQNTDYKDKISAIQQQINYRDSTIMRLDKINLSLQDTFIKYKKQDSLLKITFKERKYAKDPNLNFNVPIDSTIRNMSEWLPKGN